MHDLNILPIDREVLDFIVQFKIEHGGDSPSYRQIVAKTAASSPSHVSAILNKLVRSGLIVIGDRCFVIPGMVIALESSPTVGEIQY
jgi:CRP-like cAMP-binding protein